MWLGPFVKHHRLHRITCPCCSVCVVKKTVVHLYRFISRPSTPHSCLLSPFLPPLPSSHLLSHMLRHSTLKVMNSDEDVHVSVRFSINLCEGPSLKPNCGLHFNPRFKEGCIVRNAMIKGKWGVEERDGGLTIKKGKNFDIVFAVTPESFKVWFCYFYVFFISLST